jgi:hypothetical protein
MLQRPTVVGLILCEQVIIEENTRNVTLVNSFSRLRFPSFPASPQQFVVYTVLTDGLGDGTISLVVSRLDTLEDVYAHDWPVEFTDPLRRVRLVMRPTGLSFPEPVRYQVSLLADGEYLAQCVLRVVSEEE